MASTFEEIIAKSKELHAAGDLEGAKRLAAIAVERRNAAKPEPAPDADMSTWGRIKDNVVGVDDGVMSWGEKAGSLLNKAGESASLGLVGDEADAAMAALIPGGKDYDERLEYSRQNEAQLEEENPYLSMGAEIGGGVAGALLPLGAIGTLGRGAGLGTRMLASGAAGAGMGGTYGFMEGEGGIDDRLKDMRTGATWGAGVGAASPVVASGVKRVADSLMQYLPARKAVKAAKTAADARQGSRAQYRAFEDADAQITPEAMARLQARVAGRIDDSGAPKIPGPLGKTPKSGRQINQTLGAMNDEVQAAASQGLNPAVPLKSLEDVRKAAGVLSRETKDFRPTQGAYIAGQAVDEIDQFIDGLSTADVPVGDANAAISALKKARQAWRTSMKLQALETVEDRADDYLSGTQSGLRNQIKSLLRKNKKTKLFDAREEAALRKVIGNTALGRATRLIGDGLGAKMMAGGGGVLGGIPGAAIGMGASEIAGAVGDNMASRNMEVAKALIASGALQNLPQMSDANRQIIEKLVRRIGVAQAQ